MKKISQINWKRYKESKEGKDAYELFYNITTNDASFEDMFLVAKRFNPEYFKNYSEKENQEFIQGLELYETLMRKALKSDFEFETVEDCENFYLLFISMLASPDKSFISIESIPQANFKSVLAGNFQLSIIFYAFIPEFFIPNLFAMQFEYLRRIALKYEITLPEVPKRSDYFGRCYYYFKLCNAFLEFSLLNGLTPVELCTFLFDYELPLIKEEMAYEQEHVELPAPNQAWFLVGEYGEGERTMESGFWQANPFTERGDIMVFVEKYPVSAINSIWIALEDGVVDPFFYYYASTYIGHKIDLLEIKCKDLKTHPYFKDHKLVHKNFQGGSGYPLTAEDYSEIIKILEEKGFDTSKLPKLPELESFEGKEISKESDVSEQLVKPLLESMGWVEGVDFKGEVEFPAGRGTTGYNMNKRPDFCLHISGEGADISTKVVIEVKYFMRDNEQVKEAFTQGKSYARWGKAQVLVLCDKNRIRVYQLCKKAGNTEEKDFDIRKFELFTWGQMSNLEKRNELKRLLKYGKRFDYICHRPAEYIE